MTFCPLIKVRRLSWWRSSIVNGLILGKIFHVWKAISVLKPVHKNSFIMTVLYILSCRKQRNAWSVLHIDTTCARRCQDSTFDIAWKAFAKLQTMHYFFFFDGQQQQVTSCTDEKRAEAVAFPSSYYGIFHCFYFPFKVGNEGKMKAQILSFHSSALLDRAQIVCVWAYIRIIYSLIPGRVAPFSSCFLKQGSPSLIKRTSFSLCTIH